MAKEQQDFKAVLETREGVYKCEKESRDNVREEQRFNTDKDGHWDELAVKAFKDRPRYQFDLVSPVIDSIAGEMEQLEFGGKVSANGGGASDDVAETYEQMCRTISNMSDSASIYQDAARNIVDHGYDAWLIKNDWADVDAFEQDILIDKIPNSLDRVWLVGVAGATKHADIKEGFVDTFLPTADYKKQFPDGKAQSVGDNKVSERDTAESDGVTVSDYYYIKDQTKTLYLLSDGRVVEADEFDLVRAEEEAKGVTIARQKERKLPRCFMRKLDAGGWLTKEQETPFRYIPIIQVMANYRVIENEIIYFGATRKLMDAQRVYDYARSREIADGALAPVDKIVMTTEQYKGLSEEYKDLNSSNKPILRYNHVDGQIPPHKMGGPQPNAQLSIAADTAKMDIKEISLSHNPQQGQGLAGHSGKAYEILNERSDTASFKYVRPLKAAVQLTYQIIIDAIPTVYDTPGRQMRLTNADGSSKFTAINEVSQAEDGTDVIINDLSQGHYSFKVTAGPAYTSKRSEAVAIMTQWAALDPVLLEEGRDIIYSSMEAPGFDDVAARVRKRMIEQGRIPEDQLTDDERDKIQKEMEAAQNQPPNPDDQAVTQALNAQTQKLIADITKEQFELQLKAQEQERKDRDTDAKIADDQARLEADIDNKDASTLKMLKETSGADVIVSPDLAKAFSSKAEDIAD